MNDARQALSDAVALTTNLLHEQSHESDWTQSVDMADGMAASGGGTVLMAQAHLTIAVLRYASELAAATESEGVDVDGIPGGTSPENLLREFGRQLLESDLDGA